MHSALGYLTPYQYKMNHLKNSVLLSVDNPVKGVFFIYLFYF
ncbi:MAG: hypothetical protein IJ086_03950 [Clostridium sp.]|nr:hypothetical protein [Clostridium sp.]